MQVSSESAVGPREPFGKYTLLATLATGGMGEVLLAKLNAEAGFEKLVVIKRILPHLTDKQSFVKMFLDEARIAARLHHPNVCQTYELGQVNGLYYMAMEYLEGIPLKEVLQARTRDPRLADPSFLCGLMVQACEGLHYAHDLRQPDGSLAKVVHRDVNPRNIFVTSAGAAKILDFGIAKSRASLTETRAGAVKGTYAYMSPEQLQGREVDRRADIFALGVVTWEAFTGTRLFKRETDYKTFEAVVKHPIPRVGDVNPDIPPALDQAVSRALSRDREERFGTAREFAVALESGVRSTGLPFTSLKIASEIERAFAPELERQRSVILAAHRDPRPEEEDEFEVPTTLFDGAGREPRRAERPGDSIEEIRVDLDFGNEPGPDLAPVEPTPAAPREEPGPAPPSALPAFARRRRSATRLRPDGTPFTPPPETLSGVELDPARGTRLRPSATRPLIVLGALLAVVAAFLIAQSLLRSSRSGTSAQARDPGPAPVAAVAPPRADASTGGEPAVPALGEPDAAAPEPDDRDTGTGLAADDPETSAGAESDAGIAAAAREPNAAPKERPRKKRSDDDATAKSTAKTQAKPPPPKPPPPRPRPEPVVEGTGFLTIDSRPYATVFIDGKRVGYTPVVRRSVPAGVRTVRMVSSEGKPDRTFRIRVEPDKEVRRSVTW